MLSELKSKIQKLKKIDGGSFFREPQYKIFGSSEHRYKFNRCLSQNEIEKFERTNKIRLPFEYKEFISKIGDGGCGPAYGLYPLSLWNFELDINEPDFLSTEFLYTESWKKIKNFEEEGDYFDTAEFQEWEQENFSNKHITGSLRICHYGCAIYYLLIVSGKEAGNIWVDDRANDNGIYPATSKSSAERLTFFQWYDEWLTESIDQLNNQHISETQQ